ncbi:MAG: hypothetical protein JWQ35_524 [Bacteriovoracaceae bacterium]|nr:hypothetical protein [Bacteriovoracaceae bacterium]
MSSYLSKRFQNNLFDGVLSILGHGPILRSNLEAENCGINVLNNKVIREGEIVCLHEFQLIELIEIMKKITI